MSKTAIVVGAGIVGLATARALASRNYKVVVLERNEKAIGASIRNFGMVWPIGQPDGELYERAMLSKSIWESICNEAKLWYDPVGSLHLAYHAEEWDLLQELAGLMSHRQYQLFNAEQTLEKSTVVVKNNLLGSLYSRDEMIVDPRRAIAAIPLWLKEKYGVNFLWGKTVTDISSQSVYAGMEGFEADEIFLCTGADFEALYPEIFGRLPVTRCKLQMMRMMAQPEGQRIGPALCGGLSLVHYNSFKAAASWSDLKKKFEDEYPAYLEEGIHVMVSQNQAGELTIGDSHQYGMTHDPFDRQYVNTMILDYLKKFARFPVESIVETWNGIYPKLTNGETALVLQPEPGVTIINCLGGAGMTLSFGLCEQVVSSQVKKLGVLA